MFTFINVHFFLANKSNTMITKKKYSQYSYQDCATKYLAEIIRKVTV